ncbi:Mitochondrial porin [Orbilia oligospora]|uniref:Mitochondrial porin n=1 Tax=Orbilia oligospora TaxID=2813651 RepID=A0A7C8JCP1_ORBOL|nr:Mitochondrial porin [Orbilia oligospora]
MKNEPDVRIGRTSPHQPISPPALSSSQYLTCLTSSSSAVFALPSIRSTSYIPSVSPSHIFFIELSLLILTTISFPTVSSIFVNMAPPAFSDIAKPSLDLLNKDFYHTAAATLEVKSKAPNGVAFTVKGKSDHKSGINGQLEAKYTDKPTGLTLTQAWTTFNALDTKVELDNTIANGLKAEVLTQFLPASKNTGAKLNLHFRQPNFHGRAFFDLLKGPTFNGDLTVGHEGFLVGAEVGYDVTSAKITRYAAGLGYSVPEYTAAITASNNLSVFSASYYHKVNSQVEAGAKTTWDAKGTSAVGLEVGSKYKLDSLAFVKVTLFPLLYHYMVRRLFTLVLILLLHRQKSTMRA